MKKSNLTDEELLSYIIGDCEESLSIKIKFQLKEDLELRKRMESMAFLKGEIKNTPSIYKLKEKRVFNLTKLTRQLVLSSVVFAIGLFTQSNFEILSKKNMDIHSETVSVSAPLSWDDTKFLSPM